MPRSVETSKMTACVGIFSLMALSSAHARGRELLPAREVGKEALLDASSELPPLLDH
jgi:hypothetical protein